MTKPVQQQLIVDVEPASISSNGNAITIASIALFSLLFGYLCVSTFDDYKSQRFNPEFEDEDWITTSVPTANAYFRNRFVLSTKPESAYMVISGTDSFTVYVNGNVAGSAAFASVRPSRIFDISRHLLPGRNLVAVQIIVSSRNTQPLMAARMEMKLGDGRRKTVKSDATWRANGLAEYQKSRLAHWSDPQFSDIEWEFAKTSNGISSHPIIHAGAPETVYESLPDRRSISYVNIAKTSRTYTREFEIHGSYIEDAWFGIAFNGHYSVGLNGISLYSHSPLDNSMDVIDIGPYVSLGSNQITLNLQSDVGISKLTTSLRVASDTDVIHFGSDENWRVQSVGNLSNLANDSTAIQISEAGRNRSPTLSINKIDVPSVFSSQRLQPLVFRVSMIFAGILTGMAILVALTERTVRGLVSNIPVLPFVWGSVLLGALIIVRYDTRIDTNLPFQPAVLYFIAIAVMCWILVDLNEKCALRKRQLLPQYNK